MDVAKPPASDALARLASGIEAGVIGGLAMLGLLVSGSLLRGHVWWEIPNLLGSTFYGPRAFRSGPGMATIAGAALHLTITGTIAALFGLAFGSIRERRHLVPLGMLAGAFWYYMVADAFWQRVNPTVPLYISSRYGFPAMALLSHVVCGACLGFMGRAAQVEPQAVSHIERESPAIESHEPSHIETERLDVPAAAENSNADNSDAA